MKFKVEICQVRGKGEIDETTEFDTETVEAQTEKEAIEIACDGRCYVISAQVVD